MKKERGFTLVELMVVVSITVLLLGWGVPSYSTWKKKHDIESQMVQLYSDLQFGRMTAYGNKVVSGIAWTAGATINSYQINSPIGTPLGGVVSCAKYPLTPSDANQTNVLFDGRGFLNSPAAGISFHVAPISGTSGAGIDCVAVSSTRVALGKWNGTTAVCSPR